jgi:hypothetical protein
MNKFNFIKKAATSFTGVALAAGIFFSAGTVSAIPYNGDKTIASPVPAFNVFTGVDQGVGNESDFLRARAVTTETDATTQYSDPLNDSCDTSKTVQMRVYVHNGASAGENNNGAGPSIAHGTKVKITLQGGESSSFDNSATISSSNAGTVTDHVVINCNGKMVTMTYKSASAYSAGTGVVQLTDDLIKDGVMISSHGVAGDVWGCWDERVYVVLNLEIKEVPPVVPMYTCDLVTPTKISDNKYSFKVNYTAKNGATFKDTTYAYSDGNTVTDGDSNIHTFTKTTGKQVTVTVNFNIPGQTETVSSPGNENCVIKIGNTTVVTTPPVKLPNTGAGSTIAIFGVTSVLGAFLYRMRVLRNAR